MIVIIGDSFCSDFYHPKMRLPKFPKQIWLEPEQASWVSNVIRHYNNDVEVFGFGGASWWHSWTKAADELTHRWDEVEAIVFCHTTAQRINNAWNINLNQVMDHAPFSTEESRANQLFYKHIYDAEFQKYVYDQHIRSLNKQFSRIKTVHFTCHGGQDGGPDLRGLSGTVFNTPLMHLVVGGLSGSESEIINQINDQGPARLSNHFTAVNNHAFSNLVIESIDNYRPGYRHIDFNNFGFNIVNPNHINWPDRHWGTK